MDEMILLPAKGRETEDVLKATMPWIERGNRSWWKAWFATAGTALVTPGEFAQSVPTGATLRSGIFFSAISLLMITTLTLLPGFLICCVGGVIAGMVGTVDDAISFVAVVGGLILGIIVGGVIVGVIWQMIWATSIHGLMRLGGETAFGLKRTVVLVLYGTASLVVTAVPLIGGFVGYPWHWISTIGILREGQRVSTVRASISVLLLPMLIIVGAVGSYVVMIIWVISMASGSITNMQLNRTTNLGAGLEEWVQDTGQWPPAGGLLVATTSVGPWDLIDASSDVTESTDHRSGMSLVVIESMTPPEAMVAWDLADYPAIAEPHRIGTIAFVYHGIDPEEIPDDVWLVVRMFDRNDPVGFMVQSNVVVSRSNGAMLGTPIDRDEFAGAMEEQNELRRSLGLPELQDLMKLPDIGDEWGATTPRSP
jgi:hypothetical protein